MKSLIICMFITAIFASLQAQELIVPQNVQNAFKNLYPDISAVKWDKEGKDEFEAEFNLNGTSISVVINENGELEETETGIAFSELPRAALDYIKSNFKDYEITETAKIVDEEQNVTYETEISINNKKQDILFDAEGNHLQKHSKSGNDGEDAD